MVPMLSLPGFSRADFQEIAERLELGLRVDHHQAVEIAHRRDRHEVLGHVERKLVVERHRARDAAGHQQQRVAVGRRGEDGAAGDDAARPRHVLDHEALAELVAEPLRDDAGGDVADPGGAERQHQAHRPFRIFLRRSRLRQRDQGERGRGEGKHMAAKDLAAKDLAAGEATQHGGLSPGNIHPCEHRLAVQSVLTMS